MTHNISTLGQLVNKVEEGARDYDDQIYKENNPFKNYSMMGRKIKFLDSMGVYGIVIGGCTVLSLLAGIIVCGALWQADGCFPHLAATIWGGASAGLMIFGFGGAGIMVYLSNKERNIEITSEKIGDL